MDQIAIRMDALGPIDSDSVIAAIAYAHVKDGQVVDAATLCTLHSLKESHGNKA